MVRLFLGYSSNYQIFWLSRSLSSPAVPVEFERGKDFEYFVVVAGIDAEQCLSNRCGHRSSTSRAASNSIQEIETWVEALNYYDNNEFENSLKIFDNIADTSKILFNCGVIHATIGEHDRAVCSMGKIRGTRLTNSRSNATNEPPNSTNT